MGIIKSNRASMLLASVIITVIFLLSYGQAKAAEAPAADLIYTVKAGEVQITGYKGSGGAVEIPNTINGIPVTDIGNSAFANNQKLTSVSIPAGIKNIGQQAFTGSRSMTKILVDPNNPNYSSYSGVLFNKERTILIACPGGLAENNIPSSVTSIGSYAYAECRNIKEISIPAGVTVIGDNAFKRCRSLTGINVDANSPNYTSIEGMLLNKAGTTLITCPAGKTAASIPQSVTVIGANAFDDCLYLLEIIIPSGVTEIGDMAFQGCMEVRTINIPAKVAKVGKQCFYLCSRLNSISVDANNLNYSSMGGLLFNKAGTNLIACPEALTAVSIPPGVTSIGDYAFAMCRGLTSIDIPAGVTSIGPAAFLNCQGLAAIMIPGGVTKLDTNTFNGCTGLVSAKIPAGMQSLGRRVFMGCTSMERITFNSAKTVIFDDPTTLPEQAKIIGYDPSTAKSYAAKYGRKFEVIGTIHVLVNDKPLSLDQPPAVIENRTLVPLRAIFEALGAIVNWDNATQQVTAVKGDTTIAVTINSTQALVNGKTVTLDVTAQILNNRTLVPVRFVSESMGAKVDWDPELLNVIITK